MHEPDTINRPRRRLRRAVLAAVVPLALAAFALPAGAGAATVELTADGTLNYRAASGETNSLNVANDGTAVQVKDFAGLTPLGPQCTSVTSATVRCEGAPINIQRMDARLGDRNDSAGIRVAYPVLVDGGSGDDIHIGGTSPGISRVEFRGGDGSDLSSYAFANNGVRIVNDGVANDGRRPGFDEDNIGPDVERLTGSPFADDITATGTSQIFGSQVLTGGPGADTLRDGPGSVNTSFDMGPVPDGADNLVGGPGPSFVDYNGRTAPVNVTLNFGGADDGAPGERDEITGGNEVVGGGSAGDTLRAPAGSTARHQLVGNGGNDIVEGADGNDVLVGNSGQDTINALGGDDLIIADDGFSDVVGCGSGNDSARLDPRDGFNSCENRSVGVLRLAPNALRVEAGQVARLKLSWRHPRSWRQLRRIELRLTHRGAPVGEVTIRPRVRRLSGAGAARLVARGTRLTRRGDTVTARLALRLDRSLAGQRLAIEVEAVDTRGHRQIEPRAGSIRVAA